MIKVTVFTDGGARGNPGPSAIGVQILNDKNEVLSELSEYIGQATNNAAEYTAVQRALEHMQGFFDDSKAMQVSLNLDSQLVERQLNGVYKVKEPELQTYFDTIKTLMNEFASVTFTHVMSEDNKEADRLVNQALDSQ